MIDELTKALIESSRELLEKGLDKVDPKAVKKKFDDRKDKDIDNDGDTDSSDEYLHKRRQAISKAMKKEEVDTSDEKKLDEVLDDPKSMDRYRSKAKMSSDRAKNSATANRLRGTDDSKDMKTIDKREKGLKMVDRNAARKFRKEEVELDEGILKQYHAAAKQPWSKTVKDSKGTAGEYKQIGKGKDFTVWTAYRGSNKSQPHYVVRDDKVIGSGMAFNSALKDAKVKEKDVTHRSKFADGSILNKGMKEQVELDEGYTINHKTFSAAVQHAKSQVEKKGYTIDDDEWDRKVAMGPRKPGTGKTNRYTIDLMKGGKETKRKLQMQVYYDEGRYELNMY